MAKKLTYFILAGLVLGILVGWAINADGEACGTSSRPGAGSKPELHDRRFASPAMAITSILTTIFLNLIKMIIAPLVFATMVVGHRPYGRHRGARPGRRQGAGLVHLREPVSLTLGLILVNLSCSPASALGLPLPRRPRASGVDQAAFDFATLRHRTSSRNPMIDAMANNTILQIVIFSLVLRRRDHRGRREGAAAGAGRSTGSPT